MFILQEIRIHEVRIPLSTPFQASGDVLDERRVLVLRIRDREGVSAWGECVALETPNYLPETLDQAAVAIRDQIAPLILGRCFDHPGEVGPYLSAAVKGSHMARASVEMTCWALEAQKTGQSLAALVGGTRSRIPVGLSLGMQESPEDLRRKVAEGLKQGYRRVKAKIAPGADIDYIRPTVEALDESRALMIDANGAYGTGDSAIFQELDAFGLMMIEQPLPRQDFIGHAALQKQLETPICLDESIQSLADVQETARLESGRIVNVKPGRVGGYSESIAIHDFCRDNAIPIWCGGMLETGIGRAYNVALASLPHFTLPGDISPSARYWSRDIVYPEWTMAADGTIEVPQGPGLGVEIDEDRIRAETVREASFGV